MSAENKTPLYVEDLLLILNAPHCAGMADYELITRHKELVEGLKKLLASAPKNKD